MYSGILDVCIMYAFRNQLVTPMEKVLSLSAIQLTVGKSTNTEPLCDKGSIDEADFTII